MGFGEYLFSEINDSTEWDLAGLGTSFLCSCYVYHCFLVNSNVVSSAGQLIGNAVV